MKFSYGCSMCVLQGWVYCTDEQWYSTVTSYSANGVCCSTFKSSTCVTAVNYANSIYSVKAGYRCSTISFPNSIDMALAACPNL